MASPQTENGYTRIANEILEALSRQILSPYETRVLMFIVRNTWGRQKKMDQFSVSRIARETDLDRGNAGRALRSLISHKIVVADAGEYGFQKNYDEWKSVSRKTRVSPKTLCLPRPQNGVSQDHKTVVSRDTHIKKERKKERVKDKSSPSKNSYPGVKEFFSYWEDTYRERFGEPYVFNWGKDGKLIKDLLLRFELPKLKSLALRFLDSKDSWVRERSGYTIGVFASQINKLISTARATDNHSQREEMPA